MQKIFAKTLKGKLYADAKTLVLRVKNSYPKVQGRLLSG